MGVATSNTDMFTIDTAMGMLIKLRPEMKISEQIAWRNKGSDAILVEVARIEASTKAVEPTVVEEKEDVVTTGAVAKKGK